MWPPARIPSGAPIPVLNQPRTEPLEVGERAPDFELKSSRGEMVRLSQYLGHNHVMLLFIKGYL